jgi:hypothetical protein
MIFCFKKYEELFMRRYLILLVIFLLPVNFFGNENLSIDAVKENPANVSDCAFKINTSDNLYLQDIELYAKKSSKSNYKINLGIGLGLLIPGIIMIFPLAMTLIPVGVVLMVVPDRGYTWANGDYAEWVSPEKYNAGLACTILGGILFVTGAAFVIVGAVNIGIAYRKKHGRAERKTGSFAMLVDYKSDFKSKKDELLIGASYSF